MVNLKQFKFILIQVCKHTTEKIKCPHTFSDLPSNLLKSWNNGTWYKRKKKLVASKPEVPSTLKNHCVKLKPLKIINLFFLKLAFFRLQKIDTTQYNFFLRKNRYFAFQTIFICILLHNLSLSTNLGTTGTYSKFWKFYISSQKLRKLP